MAEETPESEETQGGGGGPLTWILLVVGLALGGVAGSMVLGPMVGAKLAADAGSHAEKTEKDDKGGGYGAAPTLHVIENVVVNPAESQGTRFLLVSIAIEPTGDVDAEGLAAQDVALRDAVIRVLAARTVEQLVDTEARDAMAAELVTAIESVTGEHTIGRILFPQYVIQ